MTDWGLKKAKWLVKETRREKWSILEKTKSLRVDISQAGKKEKKSKLKEKDPTIGSTKRVETGKTTDLRKNPKFTRLWQVYVITDEIPRVVIIGKMRVYRNPWWETKVEIFGLIPRYRWYWIGGETLPSIDHADWVDMWQRLLSLIKVQPYSRSIFQ